MISKASLKIPAQVKRRTSVMIGLLGLFVLAASACAVQENNTYPIEVFTEMHYAQSHRMQEPPVLQSPASSVAFDPTGGPGMTLDVPEFNRRTYNPEVAENLYMTNCSVCHGVNGQGNGPAAAHLTSDQSYWATTTGNPYAPPANLFELRDQRTPEAWFSVVSNGVNVMPAFENQLSEEDIWDIVSYLFDEQAGLGTAQ